MFGRLIVKLVPWWVFAFMGASFAPTTVGFVQSYHQSKSLIADARQADAPPLVAVSNFSRDSGVALLDEVYLQGELREDVGPYEKAQKGVNFSYLALQDGSDYVLLYFESYLTDLTLERLAKTKDTGGRVQVRGFLAPRYRAAPPKEWLAKFGAGAKYKAIVEPYFGTREAAISEQAQDGLMIATIAGVMNLALFFVAAIKFRSWRKLVAVRRPAKPKLPTKAPPLPMPKAGAIERARKITELAVVSTPQKQDKFQDGPIKSKTGWFRK